MEMTNRNSDASIATPEDVTGNDGLNWPDTFDGMAWATAFKLRFPAVAVEDSFPWFANAIMRGYDTKAQQKPDFDPEATAAETKSSAFYGENVPEIDLLNALRDFIKAANTLDRIKKGLFYGKQYDPVAYGIVANSAPLPQIVFPGNETHGRDLIHSIIGSATEAGELCELLTASMTCGTPLDLVGFCEETGDSRWYHRIAMPAVGKTTREIDRDNYAKLSAKAAAKRGQQGGRYSEGFSESEAINRNLVAERQNLQQSFNGGHEMIGQRGHTATVSKEHAEAMDETARQHG